MIGMTASVSGDIGFVGLVAPHVARILVGGNHKRVFPISALMVGIFVLWCDVLARMLLAPKSFPSELSPQLLGAVLYRVAEKKKCLSIKEIQIKNRKQGTI